MKQKKNRIERKKFTSKPMQTDIWKHNHHEKEQKKMLLVCMYDDGNINKTLSVSVFSHIFFAIRSFNRRE